MPLFNTIEDIKVHIGGGANLSIEMGSIRPVIVNAAHNHLISWIGDDLWEDMKTAFAGTPTAAQAALLPYVQAPLAMLTFYEYSLIGSIQFSETGIHRVESDNYKSAYKYQENEYRKWMLENGYEAIERMLIFLQANKSDYPLWDGTEIAAKNLSLVINYAKDFRSAADKNITRYTFEILRNLIEDVELFSLVPNMGQDQYDDIKTKIAAETALSAEETQLVKLIQKAVANYAIEEAVRRQIVRIEGRNVIQSEKLEPQSYEKETTPGNMMASLKIRHHDEWANRYISRMNKYLLDNRAEFPLFDAWKTEQEEAAAEAAADDLNCTPERFCDTGTCFGGSDCTCGCSRTGKSIVRI